MTESGKDAKKGISAQVMPFDNILSNLGQEIECYENVVDKPLDPVSI